MKPLLDPAANPRDLPFDFRRAATRQGGGSALRGWSGLGNSYRRQKLMVSTW